MGISPNWLFLPWIIFMALLAQNERRRRQTEGRELVRFVCTAILKLLEERGPLTEVQIRQLFGESWCNICDQHLSSCLKRLDGWCLIGTFRDRKIQAWQLNLKPEGHVQLALSQGNAHCLPAAAVDLNSLRHDHLHNCSFH